MMPASLLVACIEGVIGCGKTTVFENLQLIMKNNPQLVFLPELNFTNVQLSGNTHNVLEEIYKHGCHLCSQLVIMDALKEQMTKCLHNLDPQVRMIITDRCHISCGYFVQTMEMEHKITSFEKDYLMSHLFRENNPFHCSRLIKYRPILLDTGPKECYRRILKRGRPEELLSTHDWWIGHNTILRDNIKLWYGSQMTIVPDQHSLTSHIVKLFAEET